MTAPGPGGTDQEETMQAARRLLDGQNALVTGASSGIGRGVGIARTDEGAEGVVN